jgi:hypothetical protein
MVDSWETLIPALLSIGMGLYVLFRRRWMAEYIAYWNGGRRGVDRRDYGWVPVGASIVLFGMGVAMLLGLLSLG